MRRRASTPEGIGTPLRRSSKCDRKAVIKHDHKSENISGPYLREQIFRLVLREISSSSRTPFCFDPIPLVISFDPMQRNRVRQKGCSHRFACLRRYHSDRSVLSTIHGNYVFACTEYGSTHELEEMFRGMLSPGEMTRGQLRALVKSMDPGATGIVGLQELVTFGRARQGGGGKGKARKAAEMSLKRCARPRSSK